MQRLRPLIFATAPGRFLALTLAYALAFQALVSSVGIGMSGGSTSGPAGFILCHDQHDDSAAPPTRPADRQQPSPGQNCPFCLMAAQNSATPGAMPDLATAPVYVASLIARMPDNRFVAQSLPPVSRHSPAIPRAPPSISV